ncbi:alanine racemase [Pseudonocardiaceae bacterium YIM PH 21723]|nr:alanine racemase [Pseudonocardiaceae bacterium YIM PH 21723]
MLCHHGGTMVLRTDTATHRAETLIDLGAISHNVQLLAARATEHGAATMVVVKADGYGHGAVPVAKAALRGGATWLGTAAIDEALQLREAGITAPILTWLYVPGEDFAGAIAADIDLAVSSIDGLRLVEAAARQAGKPARVHLKVDTGLTRNGAQPADWADLVKHALASDEVRPLAIWSHLASADEPGHENIDLQATRFDEAYRACKEFGWNPLRHLANSAATLTRPDLYFDIVRPGVAAYGLNPIPGLDDGGLIPAMSFRSVVALVKRVPAGEGVSYGHSWTTPRDTTLALVPVGYADGIPRSLSGRFQVVLGGRPRDVVGRVCMDQIVVDLGDDTASIGDEVLVFGPGTQGEQTAQDWADRLGTIHYEIVCGMGRSRVRRTYVDG